MPLQHFSRESVFYFPNDGSLETVEKSKRSLNPINKFHLLVLNEMRSTMGSITSVEHLLLASYSVMTAYQEKFCHAKANSPV